MHGRSVLPCIALIRQVHHHLAENKNTMNQQAIASFFCLFTLVFAATAAGGCLSGDRVGGTDAGPVSVDIEKGEIGPFYETAAAMEDQVIFTFVPTGTNVSAYLVTYEVRKEGSTVEAADEKLYTGISASSPIVIAAARAPGESVSIAISIATPAGEILFESASSVG